MMTVLYSGCQQLLNNHLCDPVQKEFVAIPKTIEVIA